MSQTQNYNIRCPKCHEEQNVQLYDSVNISSEPDLRQKLMQNELNAVKCATCGFRFVVDKPLLYNDANHGILIYWLPPGNQSLDEAQQVFRESMHHMSGVLPDNVEAPRVHLVFHRSELIERIFLLEAGLDERVIEYIKYLVYSKNLDKLNPREKTLLFNAEDSTDDNLCFVVQDASSRKLEGLLHYERQTYDSLSEMFDRDDQTANLLELFPGPYISARALLKDE